MLVNLSFAEVLTAGHVALMRNVSNIFRKRAQKYGAKGYDLALDLESACAEFAVAKLTGKFWSGNIGDLGAADVDDLQVRSSKRDDARLILHPTDDDDEIFILVTGALPNLTVRGFIKGRDGKRQEFWADPSGNGRAAFFVPQSSLKEISELL